MTGFPLQLSPQVIVERMLNGALEGVALVALVWVLLKVVGRRSSSTHFAVWFVVLLTVGALPWVESLRWGSRVVSAGSSQSAVLIPASWAAGMFYAWAAVALASLGRIVLGLWQIRRLRKTSSPLDSENLDPALRQALEASCKRRISLYVSKSVRVPMATGFSRPMIVIPEWALRDLSFEELRVVLLHEAAHLQRWDDWTNLTQKILRAVFFFHPVVWWLEGKLALEREMACDDLVVAATSSPRAYAQCLVSLAEKSLGRRNFALAQAAVSRMRHTALRIRQILDGKRSGPTGVWKPAVGFAAMAAIACLLLVSETPKLVGFTPPAREAPAIAPVVAQTIPPVPTSVSSIRGAAIQSAAYTIRPTRPTVTKHVTPAPLSRPISNETETASVHPARLGQPVPPTSADNTADNANYRSVAFTAEETVFVVMQDLQINSAGDKVVRFNVYRLTVFYPEFYPSNPHKTLSKSI
jgi:beta-lactamase regulating signal transducer with metallopeptidase domain